MERSELEEIMRLVDLSIQYTTSRNGALLWKLLHWQRYALLQTPSSLYFGLILRKWRADQDQNWGGGDETFLKEIDAKFQWDPLRVYGGKGLPHYKSMAWRISSLGPRLAQ